MDNLDRSFWRIGIFGLFCIAFMEMTSCAFNKAYADADMLSPGGMTQVMNGVDDGTFHVNLGHTFPYYGGVFTDAWMSSNGFIMLYDPTTDFGNSNTWNNGCCSGFDPSNVGQFSYMIAPLWTDLRDPNVTNDDGYYYKTNEGISSFLWYNVYEYGTTNTNTFEVNLFPDGSFDFIYDEVDITQHSVWIGNTGDTTKTDNTGIYPEVNELMYAQGGMTEFDIEFHDQTLNGGRAWYGQDGGYAAVDTGPDCSDSLNDSSCPGYEEAYFEQQCNADPFYDTNCSGYQDAYFEQQCRYNPQYDMLCPGYVEETFAVEETFSQGAFTASTDSFDGQMTGADDGTSFEDTTGVSEEQFYGFEPTEAPVEEFVEPVVEVFADPVVEESFQQEITQEQEVVSTSEPELLIEEPEAQESVLEPEVLAQESVVERSSDNKVRDLAVSLSLEQTSTLVASLEVSAISTAATDFSVSSQNFSNSVSQNEQTEQNVQNEQQNEQNSTNSDSNSGSQSTSSENSTNFDNFSSSDSQLTGTSLDIFSSDATLFTSMSGEASGSTGEAESNEQTVTDTGNIEQNLALGEAAPIGFAIIEVPKPEMQEEVVQEKSLAERMADANIEKRKEKSNVAAQGQTAAVEQLAATADISQYYNITITPEAQVYRQAQVYSGVRLEDNNRTMYNMFSESTGKMGQLIRSQY